MKQAQPTESTAPVAPRSSGGARRRGATGPNALDVARSAFTALVVGVDPPALDGGVVPGWPAGPVGLSEVRDLLLTRSCPQRTRDLVWALLVERARGGDPGWRVGAVGVALPGLTASANRLTARFAGDPSDICSEIVAGFLGALATVDTGRPRIMVRLRWAAYRAGHAALIAALRTATPVDVLPERAVALTAGVGHPDLVLARAVTDGAITARDADLIGATRLDGDLVTDWASARGVGGWAAYKARRRAELRLRDYLNDDLSDDFGVAVDTLAGSAAGGARPDVLTPAAARLRGGEPSNAGGRDGVQLDPPARASEDPRCA